MWRVRFGAALVVSGVIGWLAMYRFLVLLVYVCVSGALAC